MEQCLIVIKSMQKVERNRHVYFLGICELDSLVLVTSVLFHAFNYIQFTDYRHMAESIGNNFKEKLSWYNVNG